MARSVVPPTLKRFPPIKQRRLDELLEKNSEGTITPREKAALERLVAEAERNMVANAKRMAEFAERAGETAPTNAVPVTVWVRPAPVER